MAQTSRKTLNSPTAIFCDYGRYYDALYPEKNYDAEVSHVSSLIETHAVGARDILEFGSGTGKHGRRLADPGYRVQGIERSATMLALSHDTERFQGV